MNTGKLYRWSALQTDKFVPECFITQEAVNFIHKFNEGEKTEYHVQRLNELCLEIKFEVFATGDITNFLEHGSKTKIIIKEWDIAMAMCNSQRVEPVSYSSSRYSP